MEYKNIAGVPDFKSVEFKAKKHKYCLCIPLKNEGKRIQEELKIAQKHKISDFVDIII